MACDTTLSHSRRRSSSVPSPEATSGATTHTTHRPKVHSSRPSANKDGQPATVRYTTKSGKQKKCKREPVRQKRALVRVCPSTGCPTASPAGRTSTGADAHDCHTRRRPATGQGGRRSQRTGRGQVPPRLRRPPVLAKVPPKALCAPADTVAAAGATDITTPCRHRTRPTGSRKHATHTGDTPS